VHIRREQRFFRTLFDNFSFENFNFQDLSQYELVLRSRFMDVSRFAA